jgi:hypothetical protein
MNEELPARLRAWSNDIMERTKIIGCDQDLRDAATELEQSRHVLELALKYWADRQQRYKNKYPAWVQAAKELGL